MACDIRIARRNAGKIGLPEVNLGVLPGTGGTQRLCRLIGKSRSIEFMVTGETFSFEKAEELGLVNQVFESDGFWEQVQLYARQFCPPNKASKAVGAIKRAVQSGMEVPFESALAIERELQQQLFQSEDAKEGIAAYIEKRMAYLQGALMQHRPVHRQRMRAGRLRPALRRASTRPRRSRWPRWPRPARRTSTARSRRPAAASSRTGGRGSRRGSAAPCSSRPPTCSRPGSRRSPSWRPGRTGSRCSSRRSMSR